MKKKIKCNKKCKHSKKAFTLVEIIAVIVIIGILSSIAIISVTGYISKTKKNVLISHENGMKTAGKNMTSTYLSENKYCEDTNNKNCPVPKENSREIVTLGQLIEEGYEQDLKNPYYKEGTDEKERYCYRDISIVQIKNVGNQNYEYKACIICGNEVGIGCSNLYDGLNKYLECRKNRLKDDCKSLLKLKESDDDETDENYQPGTNKCEKGKVCPNVQCEVEIENDKWTNKEVETSVRCIDELGGERCKRELYSKKFEAKPGSYKVKENINVYDRKGRSTACEVKVMQDVRNPYISLGLNNGKVQITYLKDNESGIATWGLGDSADTPNYNQLTELELKDGINLVYGYAKDNAGNELSRDKGWSPHNRGGNNNYYPHNNNNNNPNNYCNGSSCRNPIQTTNDRKPPELTPEDIYYGYQIYDRDQELVVDESACRKVGYFPSQYTDKYDNGEEGCNIKKGLKGTEQWTLRDPVMGIYGAENITDFTDVKLIAIELKDNSQASEYIFNVNGEIFTRTISNGGRRVLLRFPEVRDLNSLQIQGNINNIKSVYVYTRSNENPVRGKRIFTRNAVQLYFDARDDISGIKEIETVENNTGNKITSREKYRYASNNGSYQVIVVDNAGNRVQQTVEVQNIRKQSPVCQISIRGNHPNINWWFNSDVYVYFSDLDKVDSCNGTEGVRERSNNDKFTYKGNNKCLRPVTNVPNDLANSYIDVAPNFLYSQINWGKRNTAGNTAGLKSYFDDDYIKLEQVDEYGDVFRMTKETALNPNEHVRTPNYSAWTKPYGVIYDLAGNMGVCELNTRSYRNLSDEGRKTVAKYGVLIDKTNPVCTFNIVRDKVSRDMKGSLDRDYLNDTSNWDFNYTEDGKWITDVKNFKVQSMEMLSNVNKIAFAEPYYKLRDEDSDKDEVTGVKKPKPKYELFIMHSHDSIWENNGRMGSKHTEITNKAKKFMKKIQKKKKDDKNHDYSSDTRTMNLLMMDAAGNVGGCSLTFRIDDEPPVQTKESLDSECETSDGSIFYKKCEFEDHESGLATSKSGETVNKKKNSNCDGDGGTCYRAKDKAGNESYCQKSRKTCKKRK